MRVIAKEATMRVVAKKSGEVYLVSLDDDVEAALRNVRAQGRVLDMTRRRLYPPFNIHSIIARGPWYEATMTEAELQEKLAQVNQSLEWDKR